MKNLHFLALITAVTLGFAANAQPTKESQAGIAFSDASIQYSPGAPGLQIDMAAWNDEAIAFAKGRYVSGIDGSSPERWTAAAFHVNRPITFNQIHVDTTRSGAPGTMVGWKLYKKAPRSQFLIAEGVVPYTASSYVHPNGFGVDERVVIATPAPIVLAADIYFLAVYGVDYTMEWHSGSSLGPLEFNIYRRPGPSGNPHDWRLEFGSRGEYEMAPQGPNGTGELFSPSSEWDYGGRLGTGLPGAVGRGQIFKPSFVLVNTTQPGGKISGTVDLGDNWQPGPDRADPYGASKPMLYRAYLLDPPTGRTMSVFEFPCESNGNFSFPWTDPSSPTPTPGDIPPGTYDVLIRPAYYDQIVLPNDDNPTRMHAASSHWLGVTVTSVAVAANSTTSVGTIRPVNGDTNADGAIDDADLANILTAFGSQSDEDPVNGHYRYSFDMDNAQSGGIAVIDDTDLAVVLNNFGAEETGRACAPIAKIVEHVVSSYLVGYSPFDPNAPHVYVRKTPFVPGDVVTYGTLLSTTDHPVVAGDYLVWLDDIPGSRFARDSRILLARIGPGCGVTIVATLPTKIPVRLNSALLWSDPADMRGPDRYFPLITRWDAPDPDDSFDDGGGGIQSGRVGKNASSLIVYGNYEEANSDETLDAAKSVLNSMGVPSGNQSQTIFSSASTPTGAALRTRLSTDIAAAGGMGPGPEFVLVLSAHGLSDGPGGVWFNIHNRSAAISWPELLCLVCQALNGTNKRRIWIVAGNCYSGTAINALNSLNCNQCRGFTIGISTAAQKAEVARATGWSLTKDLAWDFEDELSKQHSIFANGTDFYTTALDATYAAAGGMDSNQFPSFGSRSFP